MIQKYGTFDAEGKPTGFYSTENHGVPGEEGCSIPTEAVCISDANWQAYLTGKYHRDAETGECTLDPGPTEAEQLASAKTAKSKEINAARLAAIESGVHWGGYVWDSDETSRGNLTGAVSGYQAGLLSSASETGCVITWRTSDNQDIPLTGEDLLALSGAMLAHVNEQYLASWTLKNQVDTAETVEAVKAITWS